jgi:hypothetical protein
MADETEVTWPEPRPVLPVTGEVDEFTLTGDGRLVPKPGPGETAELVAGQLKRAIDQDPRAKLIGELEHQLAEHRSIVYLLVERLGGHVLMPDIDLIQLPQEAGLTWWESRADGGWHLSTRRGPGAAKPAQDDRTPWQADRARVEASGKWPPSWGPFHRHFANDAVHRDGGQECDQPGTPRRVYVFDDDYLHAHELAVARWAIQHPDLFEEA